MAQDVSQAGRLNVQPAVHVLSLRCGHRELLVELLHEPGQEGIAGTYVTDAGKAQLLHQTILQRPVGSFYSSLGLAGVRAQDLDVQFLLRFDVRPRALWINPLPPSRSYLASTGTLDAR